jgi:RNA polymerase sigma factor (sigma-70 family)
MKTTTRKLPETEEEAVTANKGLIFKFLRKYRFRWVGVLELADAEQLCRIGLMKAFRTFDASRKTKFSTWAHMKMRSEVNEELRKVRWRIAVDAERANPDPPIDRLEPVDAIILTAECREMLRKTLVAANVSNAEYMRHYRSGTRFCCFWLRLHGYEYQSIGDLLGIGGSAVIDKVQRMCWLMRVDYAAVAGGSADA